MYPGSVTRLAMANLAGWFVGGVAVYSVDSTGRDLTGSASGGHPWIGPGGHGRLFRKVSSDRMVSGGS
jgi:hypothetical protein